MLAKIQSKIQPAIKLIKNAVRFWKIVSSFNPKLFYSNLILLLVSGALPFVEYFFLATIFQKVINLISLPNPDIYTLIPNLSIIVIITLVQGILWKVGHYLGRMNYMTYTKGFDLAIPGQIQGLDLQNFENPDDILLLNKVVDESYKALWFIEHLEWLIQGALQLIIALVILMYINPYFLILLTITLVPSLIVAMKASDESWGLWDTRAEIKNKYYHTKNLLLDRDTVKELMLFGLKPKLLKMMDILMSSFLDDQKKIQKKLLYRNLLSNFIDFLGWLGVYLYMIYSVVTKVLTIEQFMFSKSIIEKYVSSMKAFLENLSKLYDANKWVTDYFILTDKPRLIVNSANPKVLDEKKVPMIEFKNVSFKYPGTEKYIYKNLNIKINPGEDIALVGENGAGKTTFVKLLCRFYDVTEGEILINGINVKDLDIASWRNQIGTLFQDFNKYKYTVRENLYLSSSKNEFDDDATYLKNLEDSGALEFTKDYENGLDTMLSREYEKGIEPSGGQWQRIALARAFNRNSNILILDEPTSAMDAKAEFEIFQKLKSIQENKTTIIISHRFSTVRNADNIYVIENGEILESGNHEKLMSMNGMYNKLFTLQAESYK